MDSDARETARFLQAYAKGYNAGAFATPTAKELERADLIEGERFVAVRKTLARASIRTDFTGRRFALPAGSRVITHIARQGTMVDLSEEADYVFAYPEDTGLAAALAESGRAVQAVRVSAAAEVIDCWGPIGMPRHSYPLYDLATVVPIAVPVPPRLRGRITSEVRRLSGWDDDFPYYSDGSWSSLSLRGYWRSDPARSIKPAEMPKDWKAAHPGDLDRVCSWTVLTDKVPALMELIEGVEWWRKVERLRLLKMGRGQLRRHSDITDRGGGTRDGEIVRFHLPLITNPAIELHSWHLDGSHRRRHLRQWRTYYLDARKPHAVTNPTKSDRIHLVLDVVCDAAVRAMIAEAFAEA